MGEAELAAPYRLETAQKKNKIWTNLEDFSEDWAKGF